MSLPSYYVHVDDLRGFKSAPSLPVRIQVGNEKVLPPQGKISAIGFCVINKDPDFDGSSLRGEVLSCYRESPRSFLVIFKKGAIASEDGE